MKNIITLFLVLTFVGISFAQEFNPLEHGFKTPPNEAKARTWWHWISGNVSKKGITADLEAMKEVGIQEAQLFNVHLDFPQGELTYLSSEWLSLFKFAAKEAQRLDLELGFHNGPGWSSSGGPWVTAENTMQTVVYSEVMVKDGKVFKGNLPQPETKLNYYRDIAVLAFPKPKSAVKIDGLDYKNLSGRIRNHLLPDTKEITNSGIINKQDIIDLTSKINKDGFLDWKTPKGDWIILRLGHTPIGQKNRPAPKGGSGLEVDKMSKKAVDTFWKDGIQPILDELGDLVGTTVNNCVIDSYEVGATNWTAGFEHEFNNLRGYNLTAYLPTLAGYYVDSGEISERFLWDFRRTIGDLIAENYYNHFRELCHKNNMKFSLEPYWGPFDNMQVGATGDIVMCEFWSGGFPFFDSAKFVSSIAHLNGSAIVGAEAFTGIGGWSSHPASLKSIGDQAWAQGITRFVFHSYVHQPWDVAPGLALSYHGLDFNRKNTWWKQGRAFMDYIGRSQFLLQQGENVADVLVFTGESSPNTAFSMPEIKALGFDYDLIGANKLEGLTVENGYIYSSVGNKYRVLVLPKSDFIKLETLNKIKALVEAGAKVIGAKPKKSPSLYNFPEVDVEIQQKAELLWSKGFIKDISITDFLNNSKTPSDFSIEKGSKDDINFIHRKTKEADIYFIANGRKESSELIARFRVSGKQPEIWNAETGKMKDLAVYKENADGTTSIPIQLGMEEAVFVIFKKPISTKHHLETISYQFENLKIEPLSNLEILKAEYGTFLQEGLVDITNEVANTVKGKTLDFQVGRQFCDCDPAMGYKKEFRMEYKTGNTLRRLDVMEREFVNIDTENKGDIKILRAVFGKFKAETQGVPQHYQTFDITDKIKEKVASGILEIPVNDQLIEGKTAEGNNKVLRITYKTDTEARTIMVPIGQILKLSKDTPTPELVYDNDNVNWITPYEGKITYSTSLGQTKTVEAKSIPKPLEIKGSWDVSFPPNQGAPEKATFNELISWSHASVEGIRYFSGTASYRKEFILSKKILKSDYSLELDLGSVREIAEVFINGKNVGILWKAPFRVNIDDFVTAGTNTLEVKITNLWPNKLIGDEQLPVDIDMKGLSVKTLPNWLTTDSKRTSGRTTFSSWKHWDKDSELLTSGLLGLVKINVSVVKVLK